MHFISFDKERNEYEEQQVRLIGLHKTYPGVIVYTNDKTSILNPHYIVCGSDNEAIEIIDKIVHSHINPPIINRRHVRRFYADKHYEKSIDYFMSLIKYKDIESEFIKKSGELYHVNTQSWTHEQVVNLYDKDAPLWFLVLNVITNEEVFDQNTLISDI